MMAWQALVVALGAALGGLLRWGAGLWLSSGRQVWPLGTLLVNWLGAYAIGLAAAYFLQHSQVPVVWRLFVITGVLGGLTTFSSFSLEGASLLQQQHYGAFLAHFSLHTLGSLLLVLLGMWSWKILGAGG